MIGQTDSTKVVIDSVPVALLDNIITNPFALKLVFEKLNYLEKNKLGKVNIVHIGDSHIQADLFTGVVRKNLQQRFGNGGSGFSFPHNFAKTNGGHYIKYSSNTQWISRRNIYPPDGSAVGLSGIALSAKNNFVIDINVRDTAYNFNTLKIITPGNSNNFDVATSSKTIVVESTVPKSITHKIKSGEALSIIADKYNVSVTAIKKLNGLKTNAIRAGKILKIPSGEMQKKEISRSEFISLPLQKNSLSHKFYSEELLSKIYLLSNTEADNYNLSGLVFEKDTPGVIYHSIGVNGAKFSDYNKYPLFFEQLPALEADLVILSLGTNESFDKMVSQDYLVQLNLFIDNLRAKIPDVEIVVITPPPSMFKRKYPNTFVAGYAKDIQIQESEKKYASWDLFSVMGGLFSVNKNVNEGLMSADKVHYTKQGYEKQGNLFTEAFLRAYNNYIISKN